ncbi:hypothetical protein chiPu_0014935 [Chiloscyllium punctatum]|uniref:Uncharacterized protein n=1 Tax=Chiloscyllium punctatum TaxID=137246 RepID=A0A401T1D4_CHIPU|nr:hypothetical protein [Chiloscyllium punctatum]
MLLGRACALVGRGRRPIGRGREGARPEPTWGARRWLETESGLAATRAHRTLRCLRSRPRRQKEGGLEVHVCVGGAARLAVGERSVSLNGQQYHVFV